MKMKRLPKSKIIQTPAMPLPPQIKSELAHKERQNKVCKETISKHAVNFAEYRNAPNCRSKAGYPVRFIERPNVNYKMHSLATAMIANKTQILPIAGSRSEQDTNVNRLICTSKRMLRPRKTPSLRAM